MPDNQPDRDTLVQLFRTMSLIKINDHHIRAAARTGRINVIYYSPRGQEAVAAGIAAHLTANDYITTIYRGIHDQLAKGVPSRVIWAEYAGRVTGSCKGKGGPMHITHPETGVMVTTGIVGSSMPIANGLALASQIRGDKRVVIANFGDGASNIGAFHESLNLAAVWKLPIVFVCQNNLYAEHSRFDKFTAGGRISDRAGSYGIPGLHVDGNDPVAMWKAAREAIAHARDGDGPVLIEAMTFRFHGHLLGDDASYIPKEQLEAAVQNDPLVVFRRFLIDHGSASEAELAAIEAEIEEEVVEARTSALAAPYPDVNELKIDVFGPSRSTPLPRAETVR